MRSTITRVISCCLFFFSELSCPGKAAKKLFHDVPVIKMHAVLRGIKVKQHQRINSKESWNLRALTYTTWSMGNVLWRLCLFNFAHKVLPGSTIICIAERKILHGRVVKKRTGYSYGYCETLTHFSPRWSYSTVSLLVNNFGWIRYKSPLSARLFFNLSARVGYQWKITSGFQAQDRIHHQDYLDERHWNGTVAGLRVIHEHAGPRKVPEQTAAKHAGRPWRIPNSDNEDLETPRVMDTVRLYTQKNAWQATQTPRPTACERRGQSTSA